MELSRQAATLYDRRADAELLAFATTNWPSDLNGASADHAELARFARSSAYRSKSGDVQLWQARGVMTSALTGNLRALALMMQPDFFILVAQGRTDEARSLLDAMEQAAAECKLDCRPTPALVARIVAERRAYSYRVDQRWTDAHAWYERAAALAPENSRDAAKVHGGAVLTRWLAGGSDKEAAHDFAALVQAAANWPDVRDAADANRVAAELGDRSAAAPFDLT